MRLSLAMIVKNEAANLPHCLDSVKGLVDEVVVLDTGSTDGTVELARSQGARVEAFDWVGDFSAARNVALAHCTGDWILVLDADEAIDALDHPVIRKALEAPSIQAYFLWLRDYFRSGAFIGISGAVRPVEGPYTEGQGFSHQFSYQAVRLFRRQPEPVFQGRIHEVAETYFQQRGLPIGTLEAVIHHYGKVDPDKDRAKQAEYTRLAKAEAAAHPGDAAAHYNVVQQGLMVEDWPAVLASARAYLKLKPQVPMMVYLGAAKACLGLGRPQEGVPFLEAMLAQQPRHAVALHTLGELREAEGRAAEAQARYLEAMDAEPTFTLPFLNLSRLLERGGQRDTAAQVLDAGLDQSPRDEVLWGERVALAGRQSPEEAARQAWDALQALPDGGRGLWHQLVILALLAQGAREDAAEVLRRGLKAFPGNPELEALRARCGLPAGAP